MDDPLQIDEGFLSLRPISVQRASAGKWAFFVFPVGVIRKLLLPALLREPLEMSRVREEIQLAVAIECECPHFSLEGRNNSGRPGRNG